MTKKYLVPVEMDKEYAVKVGINPEDIKRIRLYGKITEVYFVEVADEKTYYELMRPIWREDKAIQRSNRCMVSNGKGKLVKCEQKCENCNRLRQPGIISYDALDETCTDMYTTMAVDEIVEDAMLLEALLKSISELTAENQTIIKMFSEGASESKIAEAVGMSKSGINYKKNQLLKYLKKILSDFRSED